MEPVESTTTRSHSRGQVATDDGTLVSSAGHATAYTAERSRLQRRVRLQRRLGYLLSIPAAIIAQLLLICLGNFRIENLSETRRIYQTLRRKGGPLLICSNHLTYIDSAVIAWALAPIWSYVLNLRGLPWNLPAGDHFARSTVYRALALVFKCIFIYRDGSRAHKQAVFATTLDLLRSGEPVMIFPEGRRSRTGRIDRASAKQGVGHLVSALSDPTVLCLYVRGDRQRTYSKLPPRRSRFTLGISVLRPKREAPPETSYRDLTELVFDELIRLEENYFARGGATGS